MKKSAEDLGRESCLEGKPCIPAMDRDVLDMIDEHRQFSSTILQAWLSGWHQANLKVRF